MTSRGRKRKPHVDGRIGLSGDRRIALNLVADEVGVPWLLKVANQSDVPVSGTMFAKGTIGGTTARPTAMFAVQGANLVAYEEKLGSLECGRRACRPGSRGLASRHRQAAAGSAGPHLRDGHLSPRSPKLHRRSAVGGRPSARTAAAWRRAYPRRRAACGARRWQRGIACGHGGRHVRVARDRATAFASEDSGAAARR